MLMSRCLEECNGQEDRLLSYHNSCKVVETIFGNNYSFLLYFSPVFFINKYNLKCVGPSHVAASDFLRSVSRLKERRILDLFFSGCSAHTIEQLLYAMNPVDTNQDIEVRIIDNIDTFRMYSDVTASIPSFTFENVIAMS